MNAKQDPGPEPRALEGIFVIASANTWFHIYASSAEMLANEHNSGCSPVALEFFDVTGRRLLPQFNKSWGIETLHDSGDRPSEAKVRTRLKIAIGRLAERIDELVERADRPVDRDEALRRLPDLRNRKLSECYTLLRQDFGHFSDQGQSRLHTDGSWWHNFWMH